MQFFQGSNCQNLKKTTFSNSTVAFGPYCIPITLTKTCCCASIAVSLAVIAAAATAEAVGMAVGGIDGVTPTSGGVMAWGRKQIISIIPLKSQNTLNIFQKHYCATVTRPGGNS